MMKLVNELNKKTGHSATAKVIAKLAPPAKLNVSENDMKKQLLSGLTSENKAYIYLAFRDVFCPIGYEITPLKPLDAYKKLSEIPKENTELWIITNGTGKYDHSFVIKRWSNIVTDLQTCWPLYYDIKQIKDGAKRRQEATEHN